MIKRKLHNVLVVLCRVRDSDRLMSMEREDATLLLHVIEFLEQTTALCREYYEGTVRSPNPRDF